MIRNADHGINSIKIYFPNYKDDLIAYGMAMQMRLLRITVLSWDRDESIAGCCSGGNELVIKASR